ncbi:MAG: methyl-accepting chemotaxis protein [Pseudomonadota bacterium]
MSIRQLLIICNSCMALIASALLTYLIIGQWHDLRNLRVASQAVKIVSAMSSATIELSLERSLSQVALNLDDPIAPKISTMIKKQRETSNELFKNSREILLSSQLISNRTNFAKRLDQYLSEISALRKRVDQQLAIRIDKRIPKLIKNLPIEIKAAVLRLDKLLYDIRVLKDAAPADILKTDEVIQRAWAIREYGGRERTLFAIATARNEPLQRADLIYMNKNNGIAVHAWEYLKFSKDSALLAQPVREAIKTLGKSYFSEYEVLRAQLFDKSEKGSYNVDFNTLFNRSEKALQTAISLLRIAVKSNVQKIDTAMNNVWMSLGIKAVVGFLAIVFICFSIHVIVVRVVRPINAITVAMNELAKGNTGISILRTKHKDEIEKMATALGIFKQNAEEVQRLTKQSEDAAKHAIEKQHNMEMMADAFQKNAKSIIEKVNSAEEKMKASSSTMINVTTETKSQVLAASDSSQDASSHVQSVAAAAEELSSSIAEISARIDESQYIAKQAVTYADNTNTQIQGLAKTADKIGEVVSLITDIAEQTNLLALNATIEAARAGEAGKGFAVVASEVKELASQTAKATDEISNRISEIQGATDSSVKGVIEISDIIGKINEYGTAIASAVETQEISTNEIAQSVEHANTKTQDANANIVIVSESTGKTTEAIEDIKGSAEELMEQSDFLISEVEKFLDSVRVAS